MYNLVFVDDEERVLEAVKNMLSWEDLNVRVIGWCSNAIDALEIMINEHVDILVTDIKMPVMDGAELIKRVKEMYPTVECLILTGYEEFEIARMAITQGVRGYLLKPCVKEVLEKEIRNCVEIIARERMNTPYRFEQRKRQAEKLSSELLNIKMQNTESDAEQVRQTASRYQDFAILRDAVVMIVIEHEQSLQHSNQMIKELEQALTGEELVYTAVDVLQRLTEQTEYSDLIVEKMVRYVYAHYNMTSLTVQHVADEAIHLNARYAGKRFLKETGMKFSEFLLKVRMEKAIALICEEEYINAEEIANRIGLGNNVQYFYRLFKQYTGKTIKEYRDSLINK